MGHDGSHTHGSSGVNWGYLLAGAVIVILCSGGVADAAISGLETLLAWIVSVLAAAAVVTAVITVRAMRNRTPDYVPGVHGPSTRELEYARIAAAQAAIDSRAMRLTQESQEMLIRPADTHYHLHVDRESLAQYLASRNKGGS